MCFNSTVLMSHMWVLTRLLCVGCTVHVLIAKESNELKYAKNDDFLCSAACPALKSEALP